MPRMKSNQRVRQTKSEDKIAASQAVSLSEQARKVAFRGKRVGTITAGTQMRARKTRRTASRVKGKRVTY